MIKPMQIAWGGETLYARPLTGAEVMHIAEIGKSAKEAEAIGLLAYITACCLCDADGAPEYQGEKDIEKVKALPFSMIRAIAEHVMAECGLEDEVDAPPTIAEVRAITASAKPASAG